MLIRSFFIFLSLSFFSFNLSAKVLFPEKAKVCRMELVKDFPEVHCDGHKVRVIQMAKDPVTDILNQLLSAGFQIISCGKDVGENYSCLLTR